MSSNKETTTIDRLYRFSWAIILYTVVIIVWGAWVRISGSGDGCGEHWPLCHGAAVPLGAGVQTWIEVSHRYSTALFGILVLAQIVAFRSWLPTSHPARRWVWATLMFTITEALIGRFLVKHGLVDDSQSVYRLLVMPLHLVNTSLLLCAEVFTAESLRVTAERHSTRSPRLSVHGVLAAAGLLILLTSGAVAALGSHLMPSASLIEGLQRDLSANSHPAVRLRLLHPMLGLLIPMGLWLIFAGSSQAPKPSALTRSLRRHLVVTVVATVLIGVLTLGLLSPVWLKLSHLTMATVLVIVAARSAYYAMYQEQSPTQP